MSGVCAMCRFPVNPLSVPHAALQCIACVMLWIELDTSVGVNVPVGKYLSPFRSI